MKHTVFQEKKWKNKIVYIIFFLFCICVIVSMCLSQYAVPVEARRVFWVSGAEDKGPCGIPDIGAGYWTLILYKSSKYS